ncbi:putative rhamnogalacturonate lyase C [Termitomyces sp. J132]|nr:hypothetical protein H2248_007273 [Termitomyces sp. 'cryptogamus']KNZ78275.1 putative rhamnogalacturonate lyase C [Termitomyces sp. J132]
MDSLLYRRPPTAFEQFKESPLLFLARKAYYLGINRLIPAVPSFSPVRIVCISDTHSHHADIPRLPEGDILIHAGDLTHSGTYTELQSALQWLANQPHPHKIFIAGNHDLSLEDNDRASLLEAFPSLTYLHESAIVLTVRGRSLHIYGSPLTPKHGSWPFQYPRNAPEEAHWSQIPSQTDVLVTHGPPAYHVDGGSGCRGLLAVLWNVRPRLHIFGHIHVARGVEHVTWSRAQAAYERICAGIGGLRDLIVVVSGIWRRGVIQTTFVNAASLGGFRDEQRRGAIVVEV